MLDGRTLKCQSGKSIETPSRCETSAPAPNGVLQLLELQGDVADGGVDLARDEVALAQRPDQLGQRAALARDELQQHERGHDAGVDAVEVAEVVVARHLAGELRLLLAHPHLDEGVADARLDGPAAAALDRVGHRARGAQVVEDRGARVLLERGLGEQRGHEVAGDELALVVDEEAAVGVAVPGDAEVGALLAHLADDELRGSPRAAGSAGGAGRCRPAP